MLDAAMLAAFDVISAADAAALMLIMPLRCLCAYLPRCQRASAAFAFAAYAIFSPRRCRFHDAADDACLPYVYDMLPPDAATLAYAIAAATRYDIFRLLLIYFTVFIHC